MLTFPVWGQDRANQNSHGQAQPGTVNYVEGQASVGTQSLNSNSAGSAQLHEGESLTTTNGRVEVLLTPGVFLRVDENSTVRMISPSLLKTEVELDKGRASVEVDQIYRQNNFIVDEDGGSAQLLKAGLYEFDADQSQVRVFDGEASLRDGDNHVKVKGGHEVTLAPGKMKAQRFDKDASEANDFYRWTALRSSYVAEANVDIAREYAE